MRKPVKPRKPHKPKKPIKVIDDYHTVFDLAEHYSDNKYISFNTILCAAKERFPDADLSNLSIKLYHDWEYTEVDVCYRGKMENALYDIEKADYDKKYKKYKEQLKQYEETLKVYEERLDEWLEWKKQDELEKKQALFEELKKELKK